MQSFKFSISGKLILLAVTTSLMTLVCTSAALFVIDQQRLATSLVSNYSTLADTVGYNCADALRASDPKAAQKILSAFQNDSEVERAGLIDKQGNWLARFRRDAEPFPEVFSLLDAPNGFRSDGFLHLLRPVLSNGLQVGHIYLQVRQRRLEYQRREQQFVMSLILVGSVIVSTILAWRLQLLISTPVKRMLDAVKKVTASGDYSVRVENRSDDELGLLSDGFNEMLTQIANRDAELANHRQHLQELVHERTRELEKKTQEAQAASQSKSQFLTNMSHEIRTPMNAILGFTEQLRRERHKFGDDERDYIDTVHTSGQHLLRLINDVLDLAKIEAGRMDIQPEQCSPHTIIAQVMLLMRAPAIAKRLTLDYQWVGPVPDKIHTDPEKLRQVLINIVGNAIKFTERGGIRILARLNRAAGLLEMEVVDTGIGIPRDQLDRIFKPFTQADYSMTRRYSGTGLGLTISRRIVELLGGALTVDSEVGVGSIFKLTVDAGSMEGVTLLSSPPVLEALTLDEGDHSPIPELPPLRILLVEDGETNRRLIHLVLRRHGCEVVDAENGQVGVILALSQQFDVILMDMQMPVKDGYTATSELRAAGLQVPIVALTAHAMSDDEQYCLNAGCSGYLSKPISERRLIEKLLEITCGPQPDTVESPDLTQTVNEQALHCELPLDDPEFRNIVEDFSVRLEQRLNEARHDVATRDWKSLAQFGHWLKGSGGTVGFHQFTTPAAYLERMAKAESAEQVATTIHELDVLLRGIIVTLQQPVPVSCEA